MGISWIMHHPNEEKARLASTGEVSLVADPHQLTHQHPHHGRHQEEDAVAEVRDGRALQDHRRLRGGHQGGCGQGRSGQPAEDDFSFHRLPTENVVIYNLRFVSAMKKLQFSIPG